MKISFFIAVFFISISGIYSQNAISKFDYRVGSGISLVGSGDVLLFNFENELNYKLNKYFTSSIGIKLGKGLKDYYHPVANFVQGNCNLYLSPFNNERNLDIRFGGGLSYYKYNGTTLARSTITVNGTTIAIYKNKKRSSFGFNMIIEMSYLISNKFLIGIELFTQPYFNDINSGVMLAVGFVF